MAGRITYNISDLHTDGWFGYRQLKDTHRTELGNLIGRPLTDDKVKRIEKFTNNIRATLRLISDNRTSDQSITNQDIKRTLTAISKLPPTEAVAAYSRADDDTRCLIDEALLNQDEWELHPKGSAIGKAAAVAIANKKTGRPRKREITDSLISGAIDIWRDMGGDTEAKAWHLNGRSSPLTRFVAIIAEEAECSIGLDHIAKTSRRLLKVRFFPMT